MACVRVRVQGKKCGYATYTEYKTKCSIILPKGWQMLQGKEAISTKVSCHTFLSILKTVKSANYSMSNLQIIAY